MIEGKDYVTMDVALNMKLKGYNEATDWACDIITCESVKLGVPNKELPGNLLSLPTLYEAAKWLREKGVYVVVFPVYDKKCENVKFRVRVDSYYDMIEWGNGGILPLRLDSYEEALNEGIKQALKYI